MSARTIAWSVVAGLQSDCEAMRLLVERIPLEGVCLACEMEFWSGLGFFDLFRQPTRH